MLHCLYCGLCWYHLNFGVANPTQIQQLPVTNTIKIQSHAANYFWKVSLYWSDLWGTDDSLTINNNMSQPHTSTSVEGEVLCRHCCHCVLISYWVNLTVGRPVYTNPLSESSSPPAYLGDNSFGYLILALPTFVLLSPVFVWFIKIYFIFFMLINFIGKLVDHV